MNRFKKIFSIMFVLISLLSCSKQNKIIEKINSVIEINIIENRTNEVIAKGTAFCFGKNKFLTCAHIFEDFGEECTILASTISGEEFQCSIFKKDDATDLCILYSENEFNDCISFSDENPVWLDKCYFIGNSQGYGLNIVECSISNPRKTIEFQEGIRNILFINVTANNGDSGAPLLNEDGKLIGIISFKIRDVLGQELNDMSCCILLDDIISFVN